MYIIAYLRLRRPELYLLTIIRWLRETQTIVMKLFDTSNVKVTVNGETEVTWPWTSAVRRLLSARYDGVMPAVENLRQRYARTHRRNFNLVFSRTRKYQRRSRRSGVISSGRLAQKTSPTAALTTDCLSDIVWAEKEFRRDWKRDVGRGQTEMGRSKQACWITE